MEEIKSAPGKPVYFADLWKLLLRRFGLIAAAALVGAMALFLFHRLTYTPEYESTATLYILRQGEAEDVSEDFSLSLKVMDDCAFFLKSHTVLDQVIAQLELELTWDQLYARVSTHNPENTRIVQVTARSDSPEGAKAIADAICHVGPAVIAGAMGGEQVKVFEEGVLNSEPVNTAHPAAYLLAGVLAAAAVYCLLLVQYLMEKQN